MSFGGRHSAHHTQVPPRGFSGPLQPGARLPLLFQSHSLLPETWRWGWTFRLSPAPPCGLRWVTPSRLGGHTSSFNSQRFSCYVLLLLLQHLLHFPPVVFSAEPTSFLSWGDALRESESVPQPLHVVLCCDVILFGPYISQAREPSCQEVELVYQKYKALLQCKSKVHWLQAHLPNCSLSALQSAPFWA